MSKIEVGDYVKARGFMGIAIFAKVQSINVTDGGVDEYVIVGPEGEYKMFAPELLTKKAAKEWIEKLNKSIDFLKKV
jgi:hypothetical protein